MKNRPDATPGSDPQAGAITILVVLLLLVLLTISAMGLSRNALRAQVASATIRQGMEVRDVADAGLEWGVFWLDDANIAASSVAGANTFQSTANNLLVNQGLSGTYQQIPAGANADMFVVNVAGNNQHFDAQLMTMGKLPIVWSSQNAVSATGPTRALLPDLWSVRADANYLQNGAVNFVHSKEAWISTKSRSVNE